MSDLRCFFQTFLLHVNQQSLSVLKVLLFPSYTTLIPSFIKSLKTRVRSSIYWIISEKIIFRTWNRYATVYEILYCFLCSKEFLKKLVVLMLPQYHNICKLTGSAITAPLSYWPRSYFTKQTTPHLRVNDKTVATKSQDSTKN